MKFYLDFSGEPTYRQDQWATTDSWSGVSSTRSVSGGILRVTSTTTGAFSATRVLSSSKRVVRFRARASGRFTTSRFYHAGTGGSYQSFTLTSSWQEFIFTAPEDITQIVLYSTSPGSIGDYFEVDWITVSSDQEVTDYVRDSYSITNRAASDDYRHAVNMLDFELKYDATIFESLRTTTGNVYVNVFDDTAGVFRFYGRFRPSFDVEYNGISELQTIRITANDFTSYLDTSMDEFVQEDKKIYDPSDTANSITHLLFTHLGLSHSLLDASVSITDEVGAVAVEDDSNALDFISTLLYEHGWVANWDERGLFSPIQWIQSSGATTDYTFDDTNIINSVTEDVKELDNEAAEVVWFGLAERTAVRVYTESLEYDDDGDFEGYPVLSGTYYPDEANVIDETTGTYQVVYQDYQDTGIRYKTSRYIEAGYAQDFAMQHADFTKILITKNHAIYDRYDTGLVRDITTFHNMKAQIRYQNPTLASKNLYYMHIDADLVYTTTRNTSKVEKVSGTDKKLEYESQYLFTKAAGDKLAQGLANSFWDGRYNYTFQSLVEVAEGTFVTLTLNNGVDTTGIVLERSYDGYTGIFTYIVKAYGSTYTSIAVRTARRASLSRFHGTNIAVQTNHAPAGFIAGDTLFRYYPGATAPENTSLVLSGTFADQYYVPSSYQWYYYDSLGTVTSLAGQTASSLAVAYNDSWLLDPDTDVFLRINGKYDYGATISKKYDELPSLPTVSGIAGYWSFDGVGAPPYNTFAVDNTGNGYNGTVSGAYPVPGIAGNALLFNGTSDYVNFSYPDSTAFTMCAWVKRSKSSAVQDIVYLNASVSGGRFKLSIDASNKISAVCIDAGSTTRTITGDALDTDWHFVCATHSGSSMILYLDGVASSPGSYTLISSTSLTGTIGKRANLAANYFGGMIDEVSLWTRVLTAEEIRILYANRGVLPLYYSDADYQLDQMASDSVIAREEKPLVKTNWDQINGNGSSTGSYWKAKTDATTYGVSTTTLDAKYAALLAYLYTTPGVLIATEPAWSTNVAISASTWTTLWAEYRSAETAVSAAISDAMAKAGSIAGNTIFRYYPGASTPENTTLTLSGAFADSTYAPSTYQWYAQDSGGTKNAIAGKTAKVLTVNYNDAWLLDPDTNVFLRVNSKYDYGVTVTKKYDELQFVPVTSGCVAYWNLDGFGTSIGGNNVVDNSGRGNNGTNTGATSIDGVVGKCAYFDGNDYIDTTNIRHPTALTYSAWIKPEAWPTASPNNYKMILSRKGVAWFIALFYNSPNVYLRHRWTNATPGTINHDVLVGTLGIELNTWAHLTVTFDGTYSKMYVNGVLKATSSPSSIQAEASQSTAVYEIGGYNGATLSYPWLGSIDEVSIWNRALSDAEVRTLYLAQGKLNFDYNDSTYNINRLSTITPKYRGSLATAPVSDNYAGDFFLLNSASPKKFQRYSGTAWADVTTSDALFSYYVSAALEDLSSLTLSTSDETTGGFAFFTNLVAKNLFSKKITLLASGIIKGGTRFNDDGTEANVNANGFWQDGDTGKLKANLQSLYRNNFYAGTNAGINLTASGANCQWNTFVGDQCGKGGTASSAYGNSFYGYRAGYSITTGDANNAFGMDAGYSLTTGQKNNFFGQNAGYTTTSGLANCAFGDLAGYLISRGSYNNLFGNGAGSLITTGGYNHCFGTAAGEALTTGTYNDFFGYRAGYLTTSGNYNVAIGSLASNYLGTDAYTVMVGYAARANNLGIAIGALTTSAAGQITLGTTDQTSCECKAIYAASSGTPNRPVHIDSSGNLYGYSSSAFYKKEIIPIDDFHSERIYQLVPVQYKAKDDKVNPDWTYYGLIAEEVAKVEPRLVHYGYNRDDYEEYMEPGLGVKRRRRKENAAPHPEAVHYDMLPVLMLKEMQKMRKELDELKALKGGANAGDTGTVDGAGSGSDNAGTLEADGGGYAPDAPEV